jgi:hypothetical protein
MKQLVNVESDHIHLMRGGDVLIHCIWIEKLMVDLIILKKHPKIINKFNQPLPYKIPRTMVLERAKYWKHDFWKIKEEFIKLFNPPKEWIKKLDHINVLRNILSHSNVKLGQKLFFYRPKNRSKLREAGLVFDIRKTPNQSNPIILKIDYSNEVNYFHDFGVIQSLDQEYFSNEAKKLNIVYSHMR